MQTFSDVFDCARRIGSYLQREMGLRPGDRAVLLYPPGQEFILAFVGCIFAGVVAVPVYPPHPYRMDTDLPRLNLIVNNSGCKVCMLLGLVGAGGVCRARSGTTRPGPI